jgi:pyridoxine/pyridoxamine 5'-phosphate oxidase
MTLYTFASHVIFETPVQGVIINSIQIMIENAPRITRGVTYRTKGQMEEWLKDLRHWLDKAQEYAEAGYWPMNDTACDKFGGCPFRDVCSKSPEVRGKFLKSDFKQEKPWNPLEPR